MDTFYLTERQKQRRRLIFKIKIYSAIAILIALLSGAFYLVAYSKVFKIKDIVVTQVNQNNTNIGKSPDTDLQGNLLQDLRNFYANRSRINSFLGADNILAWDSGKLPESDLFWKKYAVISQIQVKKNYFKRTLEIDYGKRNRYGVWCLMNSGSSGAITDASSTDNSVSSSSALAADNERCFWFDEQGVVFSQAPYIEGNLIYRVDDYTGQSFVFGDKVLDERLLPNLFKVFSFLDQFNFNGRSLRLDDLALEEIKTNQITNSTPTIYFSLRFDPAFALAPLQSIRNTLNGIQYIDLRVENRIYYK